MNIKDIAREAKVSVATVSRYFDPGKRNQVHPETQKRIEKISRKHHYAPDRTARAFRKGVHDTIGMVTPLSADIVRSPYYVQIIAGIIEGVRPLNFDLKWITIRDEEKDSINLQDLLRRHSVDGIVIINWQIMPRVIREVEKNVGLPVVLINSFLPKVRSSIVYCENKSGVRQVCDYFKKKGYKKLGMLQGESCCIDAMERCQEFQSYAKSLGYKFTKNSFRACKGYSETIAYQQMTDWIQSGDYPDAVYCANDDIAVGAINAIDDRKLKIPEDVAIIGHDDTRRHQNMKIPLTSVRQPLEALGRASVETLAKLLTGSAKAPIQLKFESELVVRDSA